MLDLQTASFHFIWSPEQASYSLVSLPSRYPKIIKAGLDVRYFLDGHARRISKLEWSLAVVTFQNQPASPHGPLQYIHLIGESDRGRLHFEVNFALAEQQPLFLCQVKLENRSSHPLSIDSITFFEAGPDSIHLSPSGQD